jgi:hypothetical protein
MEYCYQEETNILGIKRATLPICPPQIPHWLPSDCKRSSATKGRRLKTCIVEGLSWKPKKCHCQEYWTNTIINIRHELDLDRLAPASKYSIAHKQTTQNSILRAYSKEEWPFPRGQQYVLYVGWSELNKRALFDYCLLVCFVMQYGTCFCLSFWGRRKVSPLKCW